MPESFNFTWELFDKVSSAANHIREALEKAEHAIRHAEGTAKHGIASWSVMGIKMGAVAGIAQGLTTAFLHLGGEAIELAASGVKWALEAASFNENAMLSLEAVLGTRKAAHDAMAEWRSLAEGTPFETRAVIDWGKQLRIAGESAQNTVTILKAVSDLGTAMGSTPEQQAGYAGQALQALVNAKQVGIANERTLRIFRSLGVSPLKIEQNMAARLTGGNVHALKAMMTEGMVPAFEEILAVLQAIQDTYGTLGKLSSKGAGTLSGLMTKLADRPFDLFKGLENTPGFKAVKGVLRNLVDVLNPESAEGKVLMGGLREISKGLGDFLKPLTGPAGKHNMLDFFGSMKTAIDEVLPGLKVLIAVTAWFAKRTLEGVGGLAIGAELFKELASMQGGRVSNVLNAVPGMLGVGDRGGIERADRIPSLLARPISMTAQNTFHIHGSADTDALVLKMNDLQQETFTAMLERLGLLGTGG